MQRQRERCQTRAHRLPEASGIGFLLEADDDVIRVAHDDHVARGLAPSPACGPEIEHVVQVDVGKQRRGHRPLPCPFITDGDDLFFQDTRLQPLANQADDAPVPIRCSRKRISQSWLTSSKNDRISASNM